MKRCVLVTGASGYIGRTCVPLLINAGYEVHAVSRSTLVKHDDGVNWHSVDLMNNMQVTDLISSIKPSHCLHLAWYAEHGKFWDSAENYKWVEASFLLLKVFAESGGKRAVITGSCAEYDWSHGVCKENDTPVNPATVYGQCKHDLHKKVDELSVITGLSYAWARLFFLYGEDEDPARLVSSVCCSLLKGETATTTSGEQIRDFMHVKDVSSALINILNSTYMGTVNVATGDAFAVKDVVMRLANKIGRENLLRIGGIRSQDNEWPLIVADTTILNNDIKFIPSISLDAGLSLAIKFWKSKFSKS